MIKEMIVSSTALETKIALLEDDQLAELYIERNRNRGILGNIYKGKVTKVLPGMQSAFVNIGLEKDAFLYVSDFIEDNEEFDKVFTAAEEQVATVMAEIEAQERPPKRERRPERSRWRDRRERSESARLQPASAQPEMSPSTSLERFTLSADSNIQMETKLGEPNWAIASTIPASIGFDPCAGETIKSSADPSFSLAPTPPVIGAQSVEKEIMPLSETNSVEAAFEPNAPEAPMPPVSVSELGISPLSATSPERADEPASLDSAAIRGDGKVSLFSADEDSKGRFSARRRGTGARRKRYAATHHTNHTEHHSIDDMLREGQEILVQVAKEPIGKKGARVTSHIALPGRYLVYMPTIEHIGVSRKISSEAERIRLKDVILKHRDRFACGVIIRTAAEGHSDEDLVNDLNFLAKIWEDIRLRSEKQSAPLLIHSELSLVQRLLRDQFSFDFTAIRVDDELEYQRILEFVDKIYPNLVHRVKLYTKDNDVFDEYGITAEIDKLLQPKIWLKSGGYIVINQTEALVSIDINTGKFVGRGNSLEETITRTNLEAVKEIVKQIRLRDLGGIIVIDFIDMDERKNRKRVMEALSLEITKDKAPNKILEFNEFGLVAITRKRVKQSLERTLCQPCHYCSGSGLVKSVATTCYGIYHEVEKMKRLIRGSSEVMIRVHPDVARALRESESAVTEEIRTLIGRDVVIKSDPTLHVEHFNIVT
jgi:Rne/Rng family ribonuclease